MTPALPLTRPPAPSIGGSTITTEFQDVPVGRDYPISRLVWLAYEFDAVVQLVPKIWMPGHCNTEALPLSVILLLVYQQNAFLLNSAKFRNFLDMWFGLAQALTDDELILSNVFAHVSCSQSPSRSNIVVLGSSDRLLHLQMKYSAPETTVSTHIALCDLIQCVILYCCCV